MSFIAAVVLAIVGVLALRALWNRLSAAGKARYEAAMTKLGEVRDSLAKRPKPPPSKGAVKVGGWLAGAFYGALKAWDAGSAGLKLGWLEGKERFYDRWGERHPESAPEPPVVASAGLPFSTPADLEPPPAEPAGKPKLRLAGGTDIDQPASTNGSRPTSATPPREDSVAATPTTPLTGEAHTVGDLCDQAEVFGQHGLAEKEDGVADTARIDQLAAAAEALGAAAARLLDRDPTAAARVAALLEPCRMLVEAARQKTNAADLLQARVRAALTALAPHRQHAANMADTGMAAVASSSNDPYRQR